MTLIRTARGYFNMESLGPRPDEAAGVVVLIHGLAVDNLSSYYFTVAPALAAARYHVVMYDQRGHGRSFRPNRGYRLEDFSADLTALLEALELDGSPVHLVGTSFGGTVAFHYALTHPGHCASLVVIESEPPTHAWQKRLGCVLDGWTTELRKPGSIGSIEQVNGRHAARRMRWARRLLHNTHLAADIAASSVPDIGAWSDIQIPIFALYGGDSDLADQEDNLPTLLPNCTTLNIDGHGHSLLVSAPDTVTALCLLWVSEIHREPSLW